MARGHCQPELRRDVQNVQLWRRHGVDCGRGAHGESVGHTLAGHSAAVIGRVRARKPNSPQCVLRKFAECIERVQRTLYSPKKRVGVLISGGGSNLQALIDATRNTEMGTGAEICCVISNKADAFGLQRAKNAGIHAVFVNHKEFPSREAFDVAVSAELVRQKVDIVCLAGFMRILSEEFVKTWKGRLINVHPALLPKHKGTHGQRQALQAGDSVAGCTVHFVDEGVDTGAIIVQEFVPVHRNDTEETLSERILLVEHTAFAKALRLVATEVVSLGQNGEIVWNI
jgi:phosphoribosylamine--glycine ligase / phosphoribosylglycinamide formyltransferase / phosphoribosylformylglycinamidine cyclo-ligase